MTGPRHLDAHAAYPPAREINPITVAKVKASHGREACEERWHWICVRDLTDLLAEGRRLISAGQSWGGPPIPKPRGPRPGSGKTNR